MDENLEWYLIDDKKTTSGLLVKKQDSGESIAVLLLEKYGFYLEIIEPSGEKQAVSMSFDLMKDFIQDLIKKAKDNDNSIQRLQTEREERELQLPSAELS